MMRKALQTSLSSTPMTGEDREMALEKQVAALKSVVKLKDHLIGL